MRVMNIRQKIELISRIADEFHDNRDWHDMDILLREYKLSGPDNWSEDWNLRGYMKASLREVSDDDLIAIANAFDVHIPSVAALTALPPKGWETDDVFRLFISHLAVNKDKAKRLKETLAQYHISAFVAHEDITPTREWQKEIERALFTMDAMLTVHMKGFSESVWTQQEIGFALGRGTKVISLRMEEDPKGFISKDQAILRNGRNASAISPEIASILANDPMTKMRMAKVLAKNQKAEAENEIPF